VLDEPPEVELPDVVTVEPPDVEVPDELPEVNAPPMT